MKLRALACLVFALGVGACGRCDDPRVRAAAAQPGYMAEQNACTDRAIEMHGNTDKGWDAMRECRCEVQRRHQCPDLGGCTMCQDGGP